jgi:hypothetical protein
MVVEGVACNKCGGGYGAASIVVGKQAEFSSKTPKRIKLMSLPTGGASKLRMPWNVTGSCDELFGGGVC